MSPITLLPQMLDRSALAARFAAARAGGNTGRAGAVRAVLDYLDHRPPTSSSPGPELAERFCLTPAEHLGTATWLYWKWAASMFVPETAVAVAQAGVRTTTTLLALAMAPIAPAAPVGAGRRLQLSAC